MPTERGGRRRIRSLLRAITIVLLVLVALLAPLSGAMADRPRLEVLLLPGSQAPSGFVSDAAASGSLEIDGYRGVLHQWTEDGRGGAGLLRILVVDAGRPDYAVEGEQQAVDQLTGRGLRPVDVPGAPASTTWLFGADQAATSVVALFTYGPLLAEVSVSTNGHNGRQTLAIADSVTRREQATVQARYADASSATRLSNAQAAGSAFGIAIGYVLILDGCAFLRDPLRRRRGERTVAGLSGPFVNVDGTAKRQRWLARALTYTELGGASLIVDALLPVPWQARAALVTAAAVLIIVTGRLRSRFVSSAAGTSVMRGQRPVRATLLSAGATIMTLWATLAAFNWVIDQNQTPGAGAYAAGIFASLAAAGLMQRRARRISALTAGVLLARDPRPMVLYLRSFDDDRLRIRTATLGRRTLLERLSPNRFDSYEEVLARHLAKLGPVVAISPSGTSLPPIGAARESLTDDSWQSVVGQWMDRAGLIVMSVPPGMLTPGLQWELRQLSVHDRWQRTVIVTPPVPDPELQARWAALTSATDSVFAGFRSTDMSRVLVMRRRDERWTLVGASRRTEWTYRAALHAVTQGDRVPVAAGGGGR